jgi:hypothetical protein
MSIPVSIGGGGTGTTGTTKASGAATGSAISSGTSSQSTDSVRKQSDAADLSPRAKAQMQLNASIVQASMSVSISSGDNSQALVFKTALDGINDALRADFGDDAIQNAVSQDNTPEGTAGRIVALSTGFFDSFKKQNPGMDDDAVMQKFMDTIGSGMEKGFKEAREVLKGLSALGGDVASNIDKTYELVQKGYADFVASRKAAATPADGTAAQTAADSSASVGVAVQGGVKAAAG